ncbi:MULTISPECIES: DUF418 domain-containing protein [Saccharibacillus]|uniref:DUF418 domain-containing protein n=1 Tax=Saccharibacillus TaxID=456492 RepID=UPI00123917E3|nr:DUF418 domain-containing protein [Saccharibacillus sp. WB 17]MWJ31619.1 DUF418 domain-containing protein [Saccharibacillus sp. WB 17]
MKRLESIDIVRGFALLGILFVNMQQMLYPNTDIDASWTDRLLFNTLEYGISHRFFVIFAFLFGTGFYLFMQSAQRKGLRAGSLFARRLLILLLIGLVHHLFQPGEVLVYYAILGFLLLPFGRAKSWMLLAAGLVVSGLGLYMGSIILTYGMFLLGYWAGRIGLFEPGRHVKALSAALVVALLLIYPAARLQQFVMDQTGLYDTASALGGLPLSVFYVTALMRLCDFAAVRRKLAPLGAMGRMALTNYLLQTAIIVSLSAAFGWRENITLPVLCVVAIAILIVQAAGSMLWMRFFTMGPFEFLWRLGTYGPKSVHSLRRPKNEQMRSATPDQEVRSE